MQGGIYAAHSIIGRTTHETGGLADKNITIDQRNSVLKKMIERGIQVSNYFPPVYLQPFMVDEYGYKEGDFPVSELLSRFQVLRILMIVLTAG